MAFPRLQELAAAQNSNSLTDAMVNEHKLLIAELNVFGGPLALQCAEFLTQLSQTKVLKMLEIRKSIAEIRMIPVRLYLLLYCVHGDDEVGTWGKIFMVLFTRPLCTQILHQLILEMMSKERRTQARETYSPQYKVLTNDDLLTQILIRPPILCIHLFATVSKQWLRIITSPIFIKTRSQITKVDPHVGLFVNHIRSLFESDFVSLDPRLQSKKSAMNRSFSRGSTEEADNVKILQSYNGLLLCSGSGMPVFDYVPGTVAYTGNRYGSGTIPVQFRFDFRIQVEMLIPSAIYWNDGLHWLKTKNRQLMHYCLNIEDPDHPNITTIPIPQRGMTFLKSYGYIDPMQILIQMSHLLHLEGKLFEWRGSLCLVCLDDFGSSEFTIYEMMIGCSVWTVRYRVHTDDFMTPLPEGWSIWSNVWSIVLGEREQDSFLVIKLSGKVVQYNLISKTLHEIYDCGSNQLDDNHDDNDDELLQQFQAEHNVYEFIPSFASV
ncbi:hypothetical protein Tco_0214692 [Tanacetum coccineum]